MKYIKVKIEHQEKLIIFSKSIDHIAMARLIGKEVISAGFVSARSTGKIVAIDRNRRYESIWRKLHVRHKIRCRKRPKNISRTKPRTKPNINRFNL